MTDALAAALAEVEAIAIRSADPELTFAAVTLRHRPTDDIFGFNAAAAAVVWRLAIIQKGEAKGFRYAANEIFCDTGAPDATAVELHDHERAWVIRIACTMAAVAALIEPAGEEVDAP